MFGAKEARRSLARYRRKGLGDLSRAMVDAAVTRGVDHATVLDVGGGIGALQAALLEAGAERGEVVELVGSYEEAALELARDKGLEQRVGYRVVDILESPDAVAPAEIVVLNRVVCCSPDGIALAAAGARLTMRTLLLSFPRDVAWVRAGMGFLNAGLWAMRRSFRVFVHPRSKLLAAAETEGLELVDQGHDRFWEFAALARR